MNSKLETGYRIRYEAFSKFSTAIAKAENVLTLINVINTNLKYLIPFKSIKLSFVQNDSAYSIYLNKDLTHKTCDEKLTPQELDILAKSVPLAVIGSSISYINNTNFKKKNVLVLPLTFGDNRFSLFTAVAEHDLSFETIDYHFVRLLCEASVTKYQQLKLFNQLLKSNDSLKHELSEVSNDLSQKNSQLSEFLYLNSHAVRAPLSRLLGIIDLLKLENLSEDVEEIMKHIEISGLELDEQIHKINATLSATMFDKKKLNSFKK